MKSSKINLINNFYCEDALKAKIPNDTGYNFLYDRNKPYMNNVALSFDGREITYEELHTRIDEYSRALYKRGVRKGDLIAFSTANTPEAVYISYALNKLGAIECPINPLSNEYKMFQDLQIVKPKMFIGINDAYDSFKRASKDMNIDVILYPAVNSMNNNLIKFLYNFKHFLNGNMLFSADNRLNLLLKKGRDYQNVVFSDFNSNDVTELMFTGGSSGVHKAVMLNDKGLNGVVKSLDYVTDLQAGDVFMGNLPMFIAFGKLSIHYALCKNLKVELTLKALPKFFKDELYRIKPAGVFAGPIQWENFITSIFSEINTNLREIDFMMKNGDNSKTYLENLRKELKKIDLKKYELSWLKMGVSGGEQLRTFSESICNLLFQELGSPDDLWNGLGMTEMWAPISVKRGRKDAIGTVGHVIPFNNVMVIDPNTYDELDVGDVGLLCVSGPGMMLGYYNNSSETEKVILEKYGCKWYVTGDIVKVLPTGEIKYIERLKRSFVCGIENIYPQQIENILSEISEIRECIVTKIPDNEQQYVPKYHISLRNMDCDINKLKQNIEKLIISTLGESNVARYYEFYEQPLLRTGSGKLDPKPYQAKDDELFDTISKVMVKKKSC